MQYHQIEFATPEYDDAVRLRYTVLREPLGLEFSVEQLSAEYDQIHLGAYNNESKLNAYLMLTPHSDQTVQMRQVVVDPSLQKTGIGKGLVGFCEQWSKQHGYSEMILHARAIAVPFYEKLGYKKSGKSFEEVGMAHWLMKKVI